MARVKEPQSEKELQNLVGGGAAPAATQPTTSTLRSGDPCPVAGCSGRLAVMSTHVDATHRNRTLCCTRCKLAAGIEKIPR
jgi:hypothetical protein